MDKLKIGVIGNGSISHSHLRAYSQNPDAEIYALCDINEERLNSCGDNYHVDSNHRFTDVNEMLAACPELDAVSICTWNNGHAPCAIAALNAGKHVLCEKPMALNAAEAQAMVDAAKKSGKLLMIGFVRRFGNDCAVMKDMIDNGYMGEIYYAKANYCRRNGAPGGWFGNKALSGGGPLIDLGVHVIDLCRYLMGKPMPVSVYGATFHKLADRPGIKGVVNYASASGDIEKVFDVEDSATAMVRFDNDSVLQIDASFSLNQEKDTGTLQFFGTKGGAKLDPELSIYSEMNHYMTNVQLAYPTALSFSGLFQNEIDHFIDCIRNGTPCCNPAEDGVILMKILDAVYKSAETGHEVIIEL